MKSIISNFLLIFLTIPSISQKIINYTITNSNLPGNYVSAIYIDENNNKWFGTDKGLAFYNDTAWEVYTSSDKISDNFIHDIARDSADSGSRLWIATENGVSSVGYDKQGITTNTAYSDANSGLPSNHINAVTVDIIHNRWFGSDTSITLFYDTLWESLYNQGEFYNNPVMAIGSSKDSTNYFATQGSGVYRFSRNDVDGITGESAYDRAWCGLLSDNVYAVYIDDDGNQWFGTDYGACFHLGHESKTGWDTYTTDNGLINNFVQAIIKDNKGNIWFGTKEGLSVYDYQNWGSYTTANGITSNNILDIAIDKKGYIWLATDHGISELQIKNDTLLNPKSIIKNEFITIDIHPNPASSYSNIQVSLRKEGFCEIEVTDFSGKKINELFSGYSLPGEKNFYLSRGNVQNHLLNPGIYLLSVKSGEYFAIKKFIIL